MARVNRLIDLLEQDQPTFGERVPALTHEAGVATAQTSNDYLIVEFEHHPFDMGGLRAFMRGLVDGGPTRSGHRTPPVLVTLPVTGVTAEMVAANAWQIGHVLAAGAHGIILCHAEEADATQAFVSYARYPMSTPGAAPETIGRRGGGGQGYAAEIWGMSAAEYMFKADPWPLNPAVGGSGLIGTKVANILRSRGHDVNQASPSTGVNTFTGEGLAEALAGADVVLDVANSPSFEPAAVLSFFEIATANLLEAEAKAGVGHHVALSIVGLERSPGNGYFPGKLAQEARVKNGGVPYTIVRSTQFLEFIGGIADSMTVDGTVHASPGAFQPIAADDVATFVADTVCDDAINGTLEIAGPEKAPMSDFLTRFLQAISDDRNIVVDKTSKYFGSLVDEKSLVPLGPAKLGNVDFSAWFAKSAVPAA